MTHVHRAKRTRRDTRALALVHRLPLLLLLLLLMMMMVLLLLLPFGPASWAAIKFGGNANLIL